VFAVSGGKIVTPDRNIVEGITRLAVLDLCKESWGCPATVRPVPVEELRHADEVSISTTAGGVVPVTRVDGRMFGNDREGPVTARLWQTYWARRKAGWLATPIHYESPAPDRGGGAGMTAADHIVKGRA
jgi:branched-chain amino acid aminotransferase